MTVEIDRQTQRLIDGADVGLTGLRDELILVLRRCRQSLQLPRSITVRVVGDISLQVGIDWAVFTRFVKATEHVTVVAVAQPHVVSPTPVIRDIFCLELCAEQAHGGPPRKALRTSVVDVEYRAHAVAVFGLKAPRRKTDGLDHVGVGEGQTFLLAGAHQKGTVDLDAVDVNQVLIKASSTHIVGAGQLAGKVHRGLNQQVFHGSPYAGHPGSDPRIDFLNGARSGAIGLNFRLAQSHSSPQDDVEAGSGNGGDDLLGDGIETDKGEPDGDLSVFPERQIVAPFGVGDCSRTAVLGKHSGSWQRIAARVRNPTIDPIGLHFGLHLNIDQGSLRGRAG